MLLESWGGCHGYSCADHEHFQATTYASLLQKDSGGSGSGLAFSG